MKHFKNLALQAWITNFPWWFTVMNVFKETRSEQRQKRSYGLSMPPGKSWGFCI